MIAAMRVLQAGVVYNWLKEVSYFGNFVLKGISGVFFNISFLLFFSVIFSNVDDIAGYSHNEMLALYFVLQTSFYIYAGLGGELNMSLATYINNGALDFSLLRPKSTLLTLAASSMNLMEVVRNVPMLVVLATFVEWGQLEIGLIGALAGIVIMLVGTLTFWMLQFILACSGFWVIDSFAGTLLIYPLDSQYFPLSGLKGPVRWLLLYVFPIAVRSSLAAAVILGHVDPMTGLALSLLLCAAVMSVAVLVWRSGLRAYTSASS